MRDAASKAIAAVGYAAMPALIEALHSETPSIRGGAAEALGSQWVGPEIIKALVNVLADDDEQVRELACGALVKIGANAVPELVSAVQAESGLVWELFAFAHLLSGPTRGESKSTVAMCDAVKDEAILDSIVDPTTRTRFSDKGIRKRVTKAVFAAKALAQMGPVSAQPLTALLVSDDEPTWTLAAGLLVDIGEDAIPSLLKSASEPKWNAHGEEVLEAIVNREEPRTVRPVLLEFANGHESPAREIAIASLIWIEFAVAIKAARGGPELEAEVRRQLFPLQRRAIAKLRQAYRITEESISSAISDASHELQLEQQFPLGEKWPEERR